MPGAIVGELAGEEGSLGLCRQAEAGDVASLGGRPSKLGVRQALR